jgi:apolipoprotein D and lipocalin family protein
MMKKILLVALVMLSSAALPEAYGQNRQPLEVVPSVDLSRYAGTWFEIARIPNGFQKDCAGEVTATYTVLDKGEIKVLNQCRKKNGNVQQVEGKARPSGKDKPNTKMKVRFAPSLFSFAPFVWGDYWIIDLAADYSYAVVGEPDRKYLWILSRYAKMDEETYKKIIGKIASQGYDTSKIVRTRQGAEAGEQD